MLFKMTELKYEPNPVLERALDVLFILHADHEQNCSTSAMRGDRQLARRSVLGAGRRGGGALRPAARRRQRGGAADARRRSARSSNVPGVHQAGQGRRRPADGLRPPRLQELRPAREDHQADRRRGVRGDGQEPAARHRARARAHRARGRLLRRAQALPERRLLLGPHLPGDGLPGRDVPGALRHPAHGGLARAVGGDAARPRAEDRAARGRSTRAPRRATTWHRERA